MELKIYLRKKQLYAVNNPSQPVYYTGLNPQNIVTNNGFIQNNNWQDYTSFVSNLSELELKFSERFDELGRDAPIGNGINMHSSGTLVFERDAYNFVKDWLLDDVAATLNAVEVRIEYVGCTDFEDWIISHSQIRWCEGNTCRYELFLQQADEAYQCIEKTLINDNWQGWFPTDSRTPSGGKKHPRFSYCNEIKPNGLLSTQWYIMTTVFASSSMFIGITLTIINPMLALLNAIQSVLNSIPGVNVSWNIPQPINPQDIFDSWGQYFIESGGCGREHPAPLIRDYITNVCDKCGVTVNSQTAPIFFAQTLTLETSRGLETFKNDYYNLTMLHAPKQRGIRRFKNLKPVGYGAANTSDYWIPENAPDIALSDFLNKLKKVFNAEWRIINGSPYFHRKDWFKGESPVYDFRPGSSDTSKLLSGICFQNKEASYPAYTEGFYTIDAGDSCGNEAMDQMNGYAVAFTQYENQPNFGGKLEKTVEFGATRFNLDGSATCYYYDALQVVANGGLVTLLSLGFFMPWIMVNWIQVLQAAGDAFRYYGDFSLLLRDENTTLPKLLVWDGESYENAKAVKTHTAWDNTVSGYTMPTANLQYNTSAEQWKQRHYPKTEVIGKNLTIPPSVNGIYRVTDYFGIKITENPAYLINYPMYYEIFYENTLWDRFHWIDDPRKNPLLNVEFSAVIKLCCEEVKRLGLENNASQNKVGRIIKVPAGKYFEDGRITEIVVRFDPTHEYGRHIEIIGIV